MADDAVFSPADAAIPPNPGIELTVDEAEDGDELVDDEGEDDFEFETNDLEPEDNQMLGVKSNGLKNPIQQVLGIERNDLGYDGGQILSIDGGHLIEFETNGHESDACKYWRFRTMTTIAGATNFLRFAGMVIVDRLSTSD